MKRLNSEKGSAATKIIIILVIILVLAAASFGVYYLIKNNILPIGNNADNANETGELSKGLDVSADNSYLKYVAKTEDGYLYLDKNGNKKILDTYQYTITHNAYVSEGENNGALVDTDGNVIVDAEKYGYISNIEINSSEASKYYSVYKDSKRGIIDCTGKVIIPIEYDMILEEEIEDSNYNSHNDSIFFTCKNKSEDGTTNKFTLINTSGEKFFEFESTEEYASSTMAIDGKYLGNGVTIAVIRDKTTGATSIINVTSAEVIKQYERLVEKTTILGEEISETDNWIIVNTLGRTLAIENHTGNTLSSLTSTEIYFFDKDKKKSKVIQSTENSDRVFDEENSYYYVIQEYDESNRRDKYIIYNEYGEQVFEAKSCPEIYTSALTKKTYFYSKEYVNSEYVYTIYDEEFNEIDKGNITRVTATHYLKDGAVYTMDKTEVIKDVKYLQMTVNSEGEQEFSMVETNEGKNYLLNEKNAFEIQGSHSEMEFIGTDYKYIIYEDGENCVIRRFDTFEELWTIENQDILFLEEVDNCNVIVKDDKYYNFKGEVLYEKE